MHGVPEHLWRAYLEAQFEIHLPGGNVVTAQVGKPVSGLKGCWLGESEAFIVTSDNPFSQQLSASENSDRKRLFLSEIERAKYRVLPTVAVDVTSNVAKKWPDERGVLLFGATMRAALRLAAEFQQYAIVCVPRLGPVECLPVHA